MNYLKVSLCFIFLIVLAVACNDSEDVKSSAKVISAFDFAALNPKVTGVISETDKKISLTVSSGTDVSALVPTIIISEKATISPTSGVAQNFANPVKYTITAEDGSKQEYTVTVIVTKASAKAITSFDFASLTPKVTGIVTEAEKKVSLVVPVGTDVSKLVPTIVVSDKASISPASGVAQNFANAVKYTVTADDGTQQEYTVSVTFGKSPVKAITLFEFSALNPKVTGTIVEADKKINLTVAAGTDISALVPTITVSEKATVSPASGVAQNFVNPVKYTVTAEDGSQQEYLVTVTLPKSAVKLITSFKFAELTPEVVGAIDASTKHITLTVPNGTPITALKPTLVISDKATVSPASGTAQNFTNPVPYTVTAEDGTFQEYLVTVVIDATVNFTLNAAVNTELTRGNIMIISGSNFGTAANNKIVLKNTATNVTTEVAVNGLSSATTLFVAIPADQPLGTYKITVFIGAQFKEMPETFTVGLPAPAITSLNKTTVARNENIIITGTNFQASGNVVKLGSNVLTIISESTTSIEVKVPVSTPLGTSTLSVTSNSKTTYYNTTQVTVQVQANAPTITSLDKYSYSRGQTIVITGTNLKKAGVTTNILFAKFTSGTDQVKEGVPNTDGTQLTFVIPNDFITGTYDISVEVDGVISESYTDIIQITP